ncbi:MAG TPA: hypothetical protein VKX25_18300 [Bryobacteraceae bacterium]|jgi:hypothetical protein|nr:hypothetical protein [Bryobacteraceae bacterium]
MRLSSDILTPALMLLLTGAVHAATLTTSQYNNARTGADLEENILNPRNVNPQQFGKIATLAVDGDVYAQPLYLPSVAVPGKGTHNLLFIATEHDSVYAFDADLKSSEPLWRVSLLPHSAGAATLAEYDVNCPFIRPEIGITSTPVIDLETGTLYVLSRAKITAGHSETKYIQQLHALAITTGVEKFGGPVEINASVPGSKGGNSTSVVSFDPRRENPRAALLLVNGSVYLTWASSCDVGHYHGWVMAYDAHTLRQQATFNTSPDSLESGIWLADNGPAADREFNIYVITGNGVFDADRPGGRDFGDSVLKLRLHANRFEIASSFTPSNQQQLNARDNDLGSGGPLLLPTRPPTLVFGGKAGVMYVLGTHRMSGLEKPEHSNAEQISLSGIYSAAAYWNGHLYYYTAEAPLKDFAVRNGHVSPEPSHTSRDRSQYSGATPTISAARSQNGIVWLVESRAWNQGGNGAELRAYDALNVERELYSSAANPARDSAGQALRFVIPAVANGRVYFGVKNGVEVYGLLRK